LATFIFPFRFGRSSWKYSIATRMAVHEGSGETHLLTA
jgi:hypothetical protein